jgi:hypothetical protein
MSDVGSYEFEALERRVESLERERAREAEDRAERMRRKSDLWFHAAAFFWILVLAIVVTAAVTKAVVESN